MKRKQQPPSESADVYTELRPLMGLGADDPRVRAFLKERRVKAPTLEPGSGFVPVDLGKQGLRLLFWVGWGDDGTPDTYAVEVGTLVEARFFQQGIDRHERFEGRLPRGLHVDMSRQELTDALGRPSEACTCGQEPPCFVTWHLRDFDGALEAHVTHHEKHAGRVRPRRGRVDISVHLPRRARAPRNAG